MTPGGSADAAVIDVRKDDGVVWHAVDGTVPRGR